MRRSTRAWPMLAALAALTACSGLTDALTSPSKTTYKSVWINATWSGGRTGTPLESKAETPPAATRMETAATSTSCSRRCSFITPPGSPRR